MSAPRVAPLDEADWRAFADLRLRALADTLGSNDPQYRQETSFTAAQWRRRLRAHAQFAALVGDRMVGLVGAQRESVESVYLYSLWVEPTARGHDLAGALLTAAVDWARGQRARTVTLRVSTANAAARGVYERLGFSVAESNGKATGHPDEVTMSLTVG
ncbi:MAG TPA: GNAT family N-acetyltransferase [Mycobacterium sp.]|jgi:GNAT superfamily N-acetyltransferase|nr:GNAT family N-acetyltransferase [Mycobacterium sp.]